MRLTNNLAIRLLIVFVGLSLLHTALAPTANADALYTYTGYDFTGQGWPMNNQGLPCFLCGPLTGSFTLAQPLPYDFLGGITPLAFSITNNGVTLTESNSDFF